MTCPESHSCERRSQDFHLSHLPSVDPNMIVSWINVVAGMEREGQLREILK